MIHLVWMFVIGIVVGLVARAIMPGTQHMTLLWTGVLGVAGSFLGGFISRLFARPVMGSYIHPAGFVMSVVGALILLWGYLHYHTRLGL
jgi:uncharacterized membrane protein YeaQ/YmgE (transglycosylase-associated protein family)